MSHFAVMVDIGPDPTENMLTDMLAPFDENGEWGREGSFWDWWRIGGRWTGDHFLIPEDADGELGLPGTFGNDVTPSSVPGLRPVDVARKGDLHLEAMALRRMDRLRDRHAYLTGNRAFGTKAEIEEAKSMSADEYARHHLAPPGFSVYGYLDQQGVYHSRGTMLMFGASVDERDDWPDHFNKLFQDIPDDHWLVIVDCHV